MRITFIRSSTNAVGEYRVNHPKKALEALGHECSLYTLDKTPQRVSAAELVGDLLVLARQTSDAVFDLLEQMPAELRPKTVYELDDNPWEMHSWDSVHRELGAEYGQRVSGVIARCDAVTCSTPTLAARIRKKFAAKPMWVVPNAIDYQFRDWERREDRVDHQLEDKLVLGWTGSCHHGRDGSVMIQALPTIFDAYPEVVFLMQCDPTVYREWTAPLKKYEDRLRWAPPVAFGDHPAIYSLFDVNLAPLEATKFNVCKSDLKLIEGGAHGVPYVASRIAPYQEFHRQSDGIGGHLASTKGDWVRGIAELLDGERDARGQSLARYVRETRALSVVAGQWQNVYQSILTEGTGEQIAAVETVGRNAPCPCNSGLKTKRCCER